MNTSAAIGRIVKAMNDAPATHNPFWVEHAALILRSYRHWTGRDLLEPDIELAAHSLYNAEFAVLSHDNAADPCFTYANLTAQRLFDLPWTAFIGMPSRFSAEPQAQAEREHLLAWVSAHGFLDDYTGVRITRSGKRFRVQQATVWNLLDKFHTICGQAACLRTWQFEP